LLASSLLKLEREGRRNEIFPCSAILDGEYGRRSFNAGVPARIGRGGVNEVLELPASDGGKSELDAAFEFLENTSQTVRGLLS
jgi:malate dehydrogenase